MLVDPDQGRSPIGQGAGGPGPTGTARAARRRLRSRPSGAAPRPPHFQQRRGRASDDQAEALSPDPASSRPSATPAAKLLPLLNRLAACYAVHASAERWAPAPHTLSSCR